ncbi:hypothetical protein ACFE04_018975 [Oxalis oulophora]
MEASVSLPSPPYSTEEKQPNINVDTTVDSNSLVSDHDPVPDSTKPLITTTNKKRKKKGIFKDNNNNNYNNNNSSEVDSSICSYGSHRKGVRVGLKRRVAWRRDGGSGSSRGGGGGGGGEMETIALPLGMSFAAVVAQVLEKRDTTGERISSDHLSTICTSAVRESLANVFGDNFDNFLRNFEKSFGSTLRTLRYISESGVSNSCINYGHSQEPWPATANQNRKIPEDAQQEFMNQENIVHGQLSSEMVNFQSEILKNQRLSTSIDDMDDCQSETEQTMPIDRGLALYEQTSQLISVSSSRLGSVINQSVLSTMEKSVEEQTRANNLKKVELRLKKEGLDLKKMSMSLNYDSNNLKRSELAMGASMATFKAEKFKNQVEDMRHSELLKMCIDCLVFGLLIMLVSLSYGTYVFSYTRITEATSACTPFTQSASVSNFFFTKNQSDGIEVMVDPKASGIIQHRDTTNHVPCSSSEPDDIWRLYDTNNCLLTCPTIRGLKTDNAIDFHSLAVRTCLRLSRKVLRRHIRREWLPLVHTLGNFVPGSFSLKHLDVRTFSGALRPCPCISSEKEPCNSVLGSTVYVLHYRAFGFALVLWSYAVCWPQGVERSFHYAHHGFSVANGRISVAFGVSV